MAPGEVLGFNHLQLNEICVGKWGGVDDPQKTFFN